ncbi:MAG TPA: tetratricopeptide repeat protein [Thermomicrobiales bacterium]|nr:tetratricopeptide repeat protein [Thermomicrobiales bacterium]
MLAIDPLTGTYARAALDDRLRDELDRARHSGEALALCVIDLDYFKSVNDAYGHLRGDRVLHELAGRLSAALRPTDHLFRFGGDEFVLLLPGTPGAQAVALAHRLLDAVRAAPFAGEPPLVLTLSVGVAAFPDDEGTEAPEGLFVRADQRAYAAKRQGRARVVGGDATPGRGLPFDAPGRLIERDTALDVVQRFLGGLEAAGRGALAIAGPAGSGRSAFLAAVAAAARLRGYDVVTLHGAAPEAGGAGEALERVRGLPARPDRRGLLIAVDDLPALERGALERLLREAGAAAPRLALACVAPDAAAVGDLLPAARLRETIALRPLSREGLRVWLRGLLRAEPPAAFLDRLYRETGGLPRAARDELRRRLDEGTLRQGRDGRWRPGGAGRRRRPAAPAVPTPHNLPHAPTAFVGRVRDRRQLAALLRRERLVTLVGPGGIGKTRLALQVAGEALAGFPGGVWFVDLAPLTDPALVPQTIAAALGLREGAGAAPVARLAARLREPGDDQPALLILDNLEHLLPAAPVAAALLAAAPNLTVLATSRAALRLAGERVVAVPPLPPPELGLALPPATLARNAAVRLFVARARLADPAFRLTASNAEAVAAICARLEGLPLALELAAARANALPPAALLARLTGRLRLLAGRAPDLPPRHRTLRATIGWSEALLDDAGRRLFRRLGVFAGGAALDALEALCGDGEADAAGEPLDAVAALLDQSLLRRVDEADAEPRYAMLETIREYALERLAASGEEEATRRRHAAYFLALAERAAAAPDTWRARLDAEHDNLRAALDWLLRRAADPAAGLRLAGALAPFWEARGHLREGRAWLEGAARRAPGAPDAWRARVLALAGRLAFRQGDYPAARALSGEGLALARRAGDRRQAAQALANLGNVAWQVGDHTAAQAHNAASLALGRELGDREIVAHALSRLGGFAWDHGDYAQSRTYLEESLAARRAMGDHRQVAHSLYSLGHIAWAQGDYAAARALDVEGLALGRAVGDTQAIANALNNLGLVARSEGDHEMARALLEECLTISRAAGDRWLVAFALAWLGTVAQRQGRHEQAETFFRESLRVAQEHGAKRAIALALAGLAATVAARPGDSPARRAARLFGAADAVLAANALRLDPADERDRAAGLEAVRARLDAPEFAAAWAAGRALLLDEALVLALGHEESSVVGRQSSVDVDR